MTSAEAQDMLSVIDLARQTVQAAYAKSRGADEYALAVVIGKLAEIENILTRCAA